MRYRTALISVLAALAALSAGSSAQAATRLVGTVGPGFDIALTSTGGKALKTLPHGTYVLVVHDRSNIHDFHLKGPGLSKVVTSVGFVGTKSVRLTLKPGHYSYVCDPHAFAMHGSFTVR